MSDHGPYSDLRSYLNHNGTCEGHVVLSAIEEAERAVGIRCPAAV